MRRNWWITLVTVSFVTVGAQAQFAEDALRFATPGYGVGARALGMGNAFTGVANDFSALYWNPAGLAQMNRGEFSFGLSHLNYGDESSFFGQKQTYSNNSTNLNTLGIIFPVAVQRGSLVLALGFNRGSNFTTGINFERFNPGTSLIQTFAPDGAGAPTNPSGNVAFELYLADTSGGAWVSPIRNRLTEMENVIEGGGLNNWSAGLGIDIAKNLSAGVTVSYLSGTYTYDGTYAESDASNNYTTHPYDFDRFAIEDNITSDITGVNAKLGIMFRRPGSFRFGVTVKTPTAFHVNEDFSTAYRSRFDNGDQFDLEDLGSGEYDITTPWVFGAGASLIIRDLVLSGDVEYTDWSQLEFSDATPEVLAENRRIKDIFRPTANLRAGAEYEIRELGLRLRGGFIYNISPFEGDPSSFDQKHVTGGLGILLSESAMIDLAYARGWWDTYRSNYDRSATVDEAVTTNNFLMTFSFRF